jgi:hypothetical protein
MRPRTPSPATAISLLALFVALGGSSYAAVKIGSAQIKNNSIKSTDVKNRSLRGVDLRNSTVTAGKVRNNSLRGTDLRNLSVGGVDLAAGSVTGDKIAPNAVDGSKVADNALGGSDVDEGSLGQVPTAGNALQLGGRGPESFESASRTIRLGLIRLGDGDTRELARVGPLTFTGICDLDNGGSDSATISVTTTQNNSAVDPGDEDLDVGETTNIVTASDSANTPNFNEPDETTAAAPDGTIVGGNTLFAGVNVLDSECVVGGTLALG